MFRTLADTPSSPAEEHGLVNEWILGIPSPPLPIDCDIQLCHAVDEEEEGGHVRVPFSSNLMAYYDRLFFLQHSFRQKGHPIQRVTYQLIARVQQIPNFELTQLVARLGQCIFVEDVPNLKSPRFPSNVSWTPDMLMEIDYAVVLHLFWRENVYQRIAITKDRSGGPLWIGIGSDRCMSFSSFQRLDPHSRPSWLRGLQMSLRSLKILVSLAMLECKKGQERQGILERTRE